MSEGQRSLCNVCFQSSQSPVKSKCIILNTHCWYDSRASELSEKFIAMFGIWFAPQNRQCSLQNPMLMVQRWCNDVSYRRGSREADWLDPGIRVPHQWLKRADGEDGPCAPCSLPHGPDTSNKPGGRRPLKPWSQINLFSWQPAQLFPYSSLL